MATKQTVSPTPGKRDPKLKPQPDWTPMDGVSIGDKGGVKTSGIKIRGTGVATKGVTARGPMA